MRDSVRPVRECTGYSLCAVGQDSIWKEFVCPYSHPSEKTERSGKYYIGCCGFAFDAFFMFGCVLYSYLISKLSAMWPIFQIFICKGSQVGNYYELFLTFPTCHLC